MLVKKGQSLFKNIGFLKLQQFKTFIGNNFDFRKLVDVITMSFRTIFVNFGFYVHIGIHYTYHNLRERRYTFSMENSYFFLLFFINLQIF